MPPARGNRHDVASRQSAQNLRQVLAFTLGCVVTAMMMLNAQIGTIPDQQAALIPDTPGLRSSAESPAIQTPASSTKEALESQQDGKTQFRSILDGKRILVAIAAFDFNQLPHLEEVLDGMHDLCVAGAYVEVYIHATIPYPVTLIDLLNTRHQCTNPAPWSGFRINIVLLSPGVRLHLVDHHRPLFYERVEEFDIFIYTEDDIRIAPHTVSAYLYETERVKQIVGEEHASEYNVGVARYEYNYPPDIIIDDKTRSATANVTRVYWEHSWHPVIPKAVDAVPQPALSDKYVHMKNHHQGMYIATRELLEAWKEKPGCEFDRVRDRPGQRDKPSQPTEGTQRVWMSSQMLFGTRHCNVQQVIPMDKFGELTVLHLPNKNYRRVGRHGRLGGGKKGTPAHQVFGNETYTPTSSLLISAMQLHLEFAKRWPKTPTIPYNGPVFMYNKGCDRPVKMVRSRMNEYDAYAARGGVMSEEDIQKSGWIDMEQ